MAYRNDDLPLRRLQSDRHLWAKVAALWHRERMREEYASAGYTPQAARKRANEEALELAKSRGWRGTLGDLKHQLSDLLDPKPPAGPQPRWHRGTRYWEDVVRRDIRAMLARSPEDLRLALVEYLREEIRVRGRWTGQTGVYKMAFLVGFVPPMQFLRRRNAFIDGLSAIGHDPDLCDPELFRVVMRILRPYTMRPFESRQGFSMPAAPDPPPNKADVLPKRVRFARLRRRLGLGRES
jgi:hypothetical protein